jgi:glycosyltransferase involved in cell wall biosynthesis
MLRLDGLNHYYLFLTPPAAEHFEYPASNVTLLPVSLPQSSAARIVYEQLLLPFRLRAVKIDLLFTPSVAIPVGWGGQRVTVIHDMIAEQRTVAKYPPLREAYVRWMSRYAARHSQCVITVSENSRREIAQFARVPVSKITVAPNAIDPCLGRVTDPAVLRRARDRYGLPERFILYLGALERGKNMVGLIQAYEQLKRDRPLLEQQLVLAGAPGWGYADIEAKVHQSPAGGIHLIGFVDEEDLASVYSLADLFVYPSWYEGFGLPVLEAMACGTPVVVSNVSSLPEVIGDPGVDGPAGLLVSPAEPAEIANALRRVLTEPDLNERLRAAGISRAKSFRWEASAQGVLQRIHALAGNGGSK